MIEPEHITIPHEFELPWLLHDLPVSTHHLVITANIDRSWVFVVFSGALLVTAFLGPGRGILMASNLVLAGGLVLMAVAQNVTGLALVWGVTGIGMAMGIYDAVFATLSRLLGSAARNPITGVTLMAGFASTLG